MLPVVYTESFGFQLVSLVVHSYGFSKSTILRPKHKDDENKWGTRAQVLAGLVPNTCHVPTRLIQTSLNESMKAQGLGPMPHHDQLYAPVRLHVHTWTIHGRLLFGPEVAATMNHASMSLESQIILHPVRCTCSGYVCCKRDRERGRDKDTHTHTHL